ncbi:MAG: tetratricopeptide repeat protein [Pseudomonadota bacterium]
MIRTLILSLLVVLTPPVWAADMASELAGIQSRWDQIQYQMPEAKQEAAFEKLARETGQLVNRYPDKAEPLIWQGIVLSTYAGAKGGLGALGVVKEARAALEKAIGIDPDALNGSAYTSLGSLYYQVPGWPLGFGDDDQAKACLQKALALNPDGLDPNYFFGDFLLEQGEPERARVYLRKALEAPARPGRSIADAGRKQEAKKRLDRI